jgi:hypothetical protein
MFMSIKESINSYASQPITKQVLLTMLKDYKRPYDKLNELVKSKQLVLLKRGVYISGLAESKNKPTPFLIANHLLGPSYVSLDSALSYWGLIPEAVYETTSVTIQKSKVFDTAVGKFSYTNVALPYYSFDIKQIIFTSTQVAMVASAEKALCDKIITTKGVLLRSTINVSEFLLEDLRMDIYALKNLDVKKMETWLPDAPKKESLSWLIKTCKKL